MQKQLTWTFSSQISREELATCFINQRQPLSADQMSEILTTNPFTQDLLAPEDLQKVRSYLSDHFPGTSDELIDDLASVLSFAQAEDLFLNTYYGEIWPLPDFQYPDEYFNRYVSLLLLALERGPMPTPGWPHGRIQLSDFDRNVGAKALAGVEHGGNTWMRDEILNPMAPRRFVHDLVEFGALLTGFADRLDDPIWNSWLTVVDTARHSRHEFLLLRRFDSQVGVVLATYFNVRGIEVHGQTPSALSEAIPNASAFWTCLDSSVDASIPALARELSLPGQRLAGLTFGAVAKDPFASLFVRTDGKHRPLVECDFETWEFALRLTKKELDTAFGEVDDLGMRGFLPFFFNT